MWDHCVLTESWSALGWNNSMDKSKKDLERWEKAILPLFGEVMYTKVCTDCSIFTKNAQFMHVTQREAWDCGIACLLMVSKWLRDCSGKKRTLSSNDGETERTWMLKTMASESIWSVDLVHLLQKIRNIKTLEFSYLYASKSLQVDQHHRDLSYYVEDFSDDQSRVTRLFNQAKEEGWPLIQLEHQLELSQVVQLVSRSDCIAIALVDNAVLLQRLDRPYAGHYIIISGVETNEKNDLIFQIHNPDSSKPVDYISSSLFEKAWRARGTDEDIIFIVARAR